MRSAISVPSAIAFEHEVAMRLQRDFPRGWIVHDVYVGDEQIDVLAVLPQGIFVIECKAYHGELFGDPNSAWLTRTNGRTTVLAPRSRNPYRQALRKAFAVGDFLVEVLRANGQCQSERPWIHACVVVPHTSDLSGIRRITVNPRSVVPHGQGRVLLFQLLQLSAYIKTMSPEMNDDAARALMVALGGTVCGTWLEQTPTRQDMPRSVLPQPRQRLRLQIVWDS
jgi:hypothetical protein